MHPHATKPARISTVAVYGLWTEPLIIRSLHSPWGLLLQVGGSNELIAGKRRVVTNEMAMSADYHQVRSSLADKDRPEAVES